MRIRAKVCSILPLLSLLGPANAAAALRMSVSPMKVHLATAAGSVAACAVNVFNNGDDAVRVVTSVRDWVTTSEGGMDLQPAAAVARAATTFVRPEVGEFLVAAHSSRVVRIAAALPDSAVGSYWTMVYFQCEGVDRASGLGVATKLSLGTNVYVTARGTERRDDLITAMSIAPVDSTGEVSLAVTLANRGNVYHYPAGWVEVRSLDQSNRFEERLPLRVLLPETDTTYRASWKPAEGGDYQFVVTLDLGLDSLVQGVKDFTIANPLGPPTRRAEDAAPPLPEIDPGRR